MQHTATKIAELSSNPNRKETRIMKATTTLTTLVLTAILSLVAASTQAAIITTADGNGADSMVRQDGNNDPSNPDLMDTNYGNATRIFARSASGKDRFDAIFLRFDISDYASGSFTGTPTLGLTNWENPDTGTDLIVYGLNEDVDTWIEGNGASDNSPAGELTYNNAPGIAQETPADGDNDVDLTEVSVLVTDAEGFQLTGNKGDESTVSDSDFLTFLNADTDGLVTFIIARDDDNGAIDDIATKETTILEGGTTIALGSGAPTLEFDGIFIPEPTSFLLLAIGSLALFRRGRRR